LSQFQTEGDETDFEGFVYQELQFLANFWDEGIFQEPPKEYGIISHKFEKFTFVKKMITLGLYLQTLTL